MSTPRRPWLVHALNTFTILCIFGSVAICAWMAVPTPKDDPLVKAIKAHRAEAMQYRDPPKGWTGVDFPAH